jgi:hypothetical protein
VGSRALLVDARVAAFQVNGHYRVEQRPRRLIGAAYLPQLLFVIAKKTLTGVRINSTISCKDIARHLENQYGPLEYKHTMGCIVYIALVGDVTYEQVIDRRLAPLSCVQPPPIHYLSLEKVWAVTPPVSVSYHTTGPTAFITLNESDVSMALSRVRESY